MENKTNTTEYLELILAEQQALAGLIDADVLAAFESELQGAKRLFFAGAGRTGLALKMAAMRFMHLGFVVHVVGETTTPAILEGDVLIVGSGSGTTATLVAAAEKAKQQEARLLAITADSKSKLAQLADQCLLLPAAVKTDFGTGNSQQYAGSLFEQAVLIVLDAAFMSVWKASGLTKEELWPKHANLE